jgi:predicted ribonuclease YlaK
MAQRSAGRKGTGKSKTRPSGGAADVGTVTNRVNDLATSLIDGVATLFGEDRPLRDRSVSSASLLIVGANYTFGDLPLEKRQDQSRLGNDRRHFMALVGALLRTQPEEVRRRVSQADDEIREVIEQTHAVYHSSTGKALEAVRKAAANILEAIANLHDPAEGSTVLIPDTNGLIRSPALHLWDFDDVETFELLLVPPVLSELDKLKIQYRNPVVRRKAQSVIRQIKEYRNRGPLTEGVDIVKGRSRLRSFAVEVRAPEVLPWLDHDSLDDRILAWCVEAMRMHPRSVVKLVTSDINLQNKAEFAKVPFIEPPLEESR